MLLIFLSLFLSTLKLENELNINQTQYVYISYLSKLSSMDEVDLCKVKFMIADGN